MTDLHEIARHVCKEIEKLDLDIDILSYLDPGLNHPWYRIDIGTTTVRYEMTFLTFTDDSMSFEYPAGLVDYWPYADPKFPQNFIDWFADHVKDE